MILVAIDKSEQSEDAFKCEYSVTGFFLPRDGSRISQREHQLIITTPKRGNVFSSACLYVQEVTVQDPARPCKDTRPAPRTCSNLFILKHVLFVHKRAVGILLEYFLFGRFFSENCMKMKESGTSWIRL